MRRLLLSVLILAPLGARQADAQRVVDALPTVTGADDVCVIGEAEADLDAGGVRARLYNTGGLFWRGSGTVYEVPNGEGVNGLFSHALLLGGLVDGELRFAGAPYSNREFWPGPLDDAAAPAPALCAAFDRIWIVTAADLADYHTSGTAAADLAAWAVGAGAPFYVDADGDGAQGAAEPTVSLRPGDAGYDVSRAIDLGAGERPVVFGAQTAWWVMNDLGGEHHWRETPPLGIEVRVTAWATADGRERPDLYHSTFYRYEILNRSSDAVDGFYGGFYTDGDLGTDYAHADSSRSMHVIYRAYERDLEYGVPPAVGVDLLSGAYAVASKFVNGGNVLTDPRNAAEAYHFLRGRWKDGLPFRTGGDGYNTDGPPTRWLYHGEPGTYWSEDDIDGEGTANSPRDRRGMISADLGALAPGAEATLDLGLLFAQGADRLDSVRRLKAVSDDAQARYASGDLFRAVAATGPPPPPDPPTEAPTLLAPADGVTLDGGAVTFEWTSVEGATGYRIEVAPTLAFERPSVSFGPGTSRALSATVLLPNRTAPSYWRVVPMNIEEDGPPSEVRTITYYHYREGPLRLRDGTPAFVEVSGPGGADPCGADAVSTDGCDEVGGNAIIGSMNGTGDYLATHLGDGSEKTISGFAPTDFEVRFTAEGSIAYHPFTSGRAVRVPFEVWDVGVVPPGQPNDPADDVQMIVNLYSDAAVEAGDDALECRFAFDGPSGLDVGPTTSRIYAYPGDYAAWEAAIAPVVEADPTGCPADPETAEAANHIDFGRGRPIQRFVLERAGEVTPADLEGTVIRFYTTDPVTPAEDAPEAGPLALAVYPNPTGRDATVRFALDRPGAVTLRVLDVLGREVAVLAEGDRPAGTHRAALPAASLAPGVYLVVLDGGAARAVRMLTVVR